MSEPAGEAAIREFGRTVADIHARNERFARMRAEAEQVTVRETSPNGGVTVTVNSSGIVTDLVIDPATAPPVDRIAGEIMSTMRRAQGRLADRVGDVMRSTMGDDTDTMNRVTEIYRTSFPEPSDDDAAAGRAGASAAEDDWDDEGFGSILR